MDIVLNPSDSMAIFKENIVLRPSVVLDLLYLICPCPFLKACLPTFPGRLTYFPAVPSVAMEVKTAKATPSWYLFDSLIKHGV